nr:MAG TPA: hypothetical protein [Caudoviricetes sp.]
MPLKNAISFQKMPIFAVHYIFVGGNVRQFTAGIFYAPM